MNLSPASKRWAVPGHPLRVVQGSWLESSGCPRQACDAPGPGISPALHCLVRVGLDFPGWGEPLGCAGRRKTWYNFLSSPLFSDCWDYGCLPVSVGNLENHFQIWNKHLFITNFLCQALFSVLGVQNMKQNSWPHRVSILVGGDR